jgi:Ni,Fe-hydrogenase maturation factor
MEHLAKVEIVSAHFLDVFKWLRKEMDFSIIEAKELSKDGQIIDFRGDCNKALAFYNYLNQMITTSAKLIINDTFDSRGAVGSYVITKEEIVDDEKYFKEWDSIKDN